MEVKTRPIDRKEELRTTVNTMETSILLVEDNKKLAKYLKRSLAAEGYAVSTESRGDIAAYRIIREQPDLVILDIMLPGMSGDKICQTVRDEYQGKILMLTAINTIQDEISNLNQGADDYLTKPLQEEVLKARLAALLRRPKLTDVSYTIQLDTLEVNLLKKEVKLLGKTVDLSPSEYELLALLVKNADSILSRDTITYALRGHEYDGVDRSIDLNISRLRKLLSDDVSKPYRIKTVYRKGYTLLSDTWESQC